MADIYATIIRQRVDAVLEFVVGNTNKKTKDFADKHSILRLSTYGDLSELLVNVDIEAVIIASPEWSREYELRALLDNDFHLLIEKPFMVDFNKSLHFIKSLKSFEQIIQYGNVLRFSPKFDACKKAVDNGEIGEIRHIFARRDSNRQRVKRVLGKTDLAYWLAPHDLDMLYYLTGSQIRDIHTMSLHGGSNEDDYIIASITFENDVCAVLQNSWCTPAISNLTQNAVFEVYGTNGKIEIVDSDMDVRIFSENMTTQPDTYEFSSVNNVNYGIFYNLLDNFIKRIMKNDIKGNQGVIEAIETNMQMCNLLSESIRRK